MAFDVELYTHEADRTALKALKAIPGFSALLKGFMSVWNERQQKILNMSSRIRLGENQMRKYYDMLPPICAKLGIPVPELYLEMNVAPNAYTSGDTEPFIVITSGLLRTMPEELIPTVLAHECGHIACRHVLYLTMGRIVLTGAGSILAAKLPLGSLLTIPLQQAFYYWMRCSEFSADRAAVLCDGTDRKMQEVCMRFAGWDREIDAETSLDAFLDQAAGYREMIQESKWNKALEFMILSHASHPLTAVRATECREWFRSVAYEAARFGAADTALPPAIGRIDTPERRVESAPAPVKAAAGAEGTVLVPEDYRPLPSKPTDPEGAASYGRVTTQSDIFVQVLPAVPGDGISFEKQEIIGKLHREMTDGEGLVEVRTGTTGKGKRYACSIVKSLPKPRAVEYRVNLFIERENGVSEVKGYFMETGATGFREASVKGRVQREYPGMAEADFEGIWRRDPYDPLFTRGVLMNVSERAEYDLRFPLHPLTEARKFITAAAELN